MYLGNHTPVYRKFLSYFQEYYFLLSQDLSYFIILEPTGKIAPKVPGQKYDGGKIFIYPHNKTSVMTCEVVGYPVPFYR